MQQSISVKAPAKINYLLDVLSKRPDGYHELRMIMQRVNLCDEIIIKSSDIPGIRLTCKGSKYAPDGEKNIAWRAARALSDFYADRSGVDIFIKKNIPVAAGLGGGSSDCAAVLLGLNKLFDIGLSRTQLMNIGVTLGADVPFFVFENTAIAEGIGEKLTAMAPLPDAWVLLVNPNLPVSTAWVYKNLQLTQRNALVTIPDSFKDLSAVCKVISNDLESVTIPAFPVISEIKDMLISKGALCALMSGSGPTVFGLFEDEKTAIKAGDELSCKREWFVAAVKTI